jgi:hypothetical protein
MSLAHLSNRCDDYDIMSFYNGYERVECLNGNFIDFEGCFGYERRYSYYGSQVFTVITIIKVIRGTWLSG